MKIKKMVATLGVAASLLLASVGNLSVSAEEIPTGETTVSTEGTEAAGESTVTGCEGKYVNIALVVDTTGSMGYDIQVVKRNLTAFVQEIAASGAIPRVSLIEYRDYLEDGEDSTVVHTTPDYSVWYDDVSQIVAEIDTLEADGGGDAPESLLDALGYVCNDDTMTFNASAAKFAIVLTDIGYDTVNRWGYTSLEDSANALLAKGIQTTVVTHLNSSDWSYDYETDTYLRDDMTLAECYAPLTTITGGTQIDMTDEFATDLSAYAKTIIAATAETVVDESVVNVSGITLTGVETGADVKHGVGGTYKIHADVTPAEATNKSIIWESLNKDIAVINAEATTDTDCYINALAEGTATIVAKSADGGYTAYFKLTVTDGEVDATTGEAIASVSKVADVISGTEATKVTVIRDEKTGTTVDETVLAEIFSALDAAEGKKVEFSFADGTGKESFSWTFDGADITDASKSITDFAVDPAASVPEVTSALDSLAKDYGLDLTNSYTEIHFNHHGELPGKATVKVDITGTSLATVASGTKVFLYYYDPVTKEIKEQVEATIEDGYAIFPITHCSDYILVTKELKKAEDAVQTPAAQAPTTQAAATTAPEAPKAEAAKTPKTGDATNAFPFVVALICGCAAMGVVVVRRRTVR